MAHARLKERPNLSEERSDEIEPVEMKAMPDKPTSSEDKPTPSEDKPTSSEQAEFESLLVRVAVLEADHRELQAKYYELSGRFFTHERMNAENKVKQRNYSALLFILLGYSLYSDKSYSSSYLCLGAAIGLLLNHLVELSSPASGAPIKNANPIPSPAFNRK